jgi:hypothetical protein
MKEIVIYEFQLKSILNALTLMADTYECREQRTCLHRMLIQAERFAENALNGEKDKRVVYGQRK